MVFICYIWHMIRSLNLINWVYLMSETRKEKNCLVQICMQVSHIRGTYTRRFSNGRQHICWLALIQLRMYASFYILKQRTFHEICFSYFCLLLQCSGLRIGVWLLLLFSGYNILRSDWLIQYWFVQRRLVDADILDV